MKIILQCLIMFSISVSGQILNHSFENWVGGEPVSWFTSNNGEPVPGVINITQTTKAQHGLYAVRGVTVAYEYMGVPMIWPPHLRTYDYGVIGFPINFRPNKLRGYYIFEPVGSSDRLSIGVYLTKWNGTDHVVVGWGSRNIANTASLDTVYTAFDVSIFYLYPDIPDTISISFSIDSNVEGGVYYIDNLSLDFLEILIPNENELVISGEKDTIIWETSAENINLLYSLDEGTSFTNIVSNYPADSLKYIWDVPEDLISAKSVIRIENSSNTTQKFDQPVKIKPWQLSKVDENGNYITPLFQPNRDGWSFDNSGSNVWPQSWWQQFDYFLGIDPNTNHIYPLLLQFRFANGSDFIDWPLFVEVFGVPQCYFADLDYKTRALNYWQAIRDDWGGSCDGFAVTSLLAYYNKAELLNRFPEIGDFTILTSAPLNDESRKAINYYFAFQFGNPFLTILTSAPARETLAELKEMFERDNGDGKTLLFYSNDSTSPGGHMVTPYKLERIGDTPVFNLRVYDSNDPGSSNQIIKIDSAANTWTDQTGLGWGTGTTGAILNLENAVHLTIPTLPKNNSKARGYNEYPKFPSGGLQLFNNSRNGILITNDFGETIGFSDSVLVQNITDALPIIPKTGNVHPPIGYRIPPGNYSVELNNLVDSLAYLIFMQDSIIYNYFRSDAEVDQLDQVYFNEGIAFKNSDQVAKNIMLQTVLDDENSEKVFLIENMNLTHNDSVFFSESDRDKLIIKNYGQNKNYDLWLRSASDNGQSIFIHPAIPQNFNSSHTIVPDWNDLQNQPVKILIDLGNDGTIDDSMFVKNQATNVEDEGSLLSPDSYNLAQNYPNPFNPVTTIKYSIPESGNVSLKVYDILGNEVASLVNEEKGPGVYSVTFDASKLSSGVYLYKLQAGSFTESKKMLLMK